MVIVHNFIISNTGKFLSFWCPRVAAYNWPNCPRPFERKGWTEYRFHSHYKLRYFAQFEMSPFTVETIPLLHSRTVAGFSLFSILFFFRNIQRREWIPLVPRAWVSWVEQCSFRLLFSSSFFLPVARDAYNSAWGLAYGFYGRVMGPLASPAGIAQKYGARSQYSRSPAFSQSLRTHHTFPRTPTSSLTQSSIFLELGYIGPWSTLLITKTSAVHFVTLNNVNSDNRISFLSRLIYHGGIKQR